MKLGYFAGVGTVVELELKQRLRSKSWYIMLAVWFAVIALVTGLAAYTASPSVNGGMGGEDTGQLMFELVAGFVLLFGLLVVPALSANSITGDRSGGTLAVLQNTLLTPGQILWGKWLAAWIAALAFLVVTLPMIAWAMSYGDVYLPAVPVILLMIAVELGVACAIGVGISARASRPLFAVVSTYLVVALLTLGTLIAFGLSLRFTEEQVVDYEVVNPKDPWSQVEHDPETGMTLDEDGEPMSPVEEAEFYEKLESENQGYVYREEDEICTERSYERTVLHSERTAWLLAANPFAVVADTVPLDPADEVDDGSYYSPDGPIGAIQMGVRGAQAGFDNVDCIDGVRQSGTTEDPRELTPMWPLGLGVQALLAGVLVFSGRQRLVTPAGKLAAGTRIA
ncbi:ABC transporter permease [Zhihengliuella halotolerans]|uniref:ABC-type transport system involved in multi-copper enzyme maturation permease subunit n=1 Tax=Zhihengliuella halotolerans TaxID=370736 RepID=A0A4Q8AGV8_9MICC|nr:ABC transporter permease subunit [Zhihengliuella halotolerans]RZU63620.1 ABC-type transport system involved in multi-copper enzyme maturation permease subunit [Zhihengliuella halotolerans]